MIELENYIKDHGITIKETSDSALSCPVNHAQRYKELKEFATWTVDNELPNEQYYLSEVDSERYAERDFKARLKRIEELEKRTPAQREADIHAHIMHEIFPNLPIHEINPQKNQGISVKQERRAA